MFIHVVVLLLEIWLPLTPHSYLLLSDGLLFDRLYPHMSRRRDVRARRGVCGNGQPLLDQRPTTAPAVPTTPGQSAGRKPNHAATVARIRAEVAGDSFHQLLVVLGRARHEHGRRQLGEEWPHGGNGDGDDADGALEHAPDHRLRDGVCSRELASPAAFLGHHKAFARNGRLNGRSLLTGNIRPIVSDLIETRQSHSARNRGARRPQLAPISLLSCTRHWRYSQSSCDEEERRADLLLERNREPQEIRERRQA